MKKLLLLFCSLLLVAGCGKPAATLPTVIGSGSVDIPCLLYTSPSPRDYGESRMPSSA